MKNKPILKSISSACSAPKDPIILGKFGSPCGIRGWLRVFSATEDAENIFDYDPWLIFFTGKWQSVPLEEWKWQGKTLIVKIHGIDDRDAASTLTHCEITVDSSQLPALNGDDYYWKDLIGCEVFTSEGRNLGIVNALMETGSNDVLVVKARLDEITKVKERLIPFIHQQVIKQVDLVLKRIEVNWDPEF